MKKSYILLVFFVSLTACTHIKIVSFDNAEKTVVVQGGKWAKDEDYEKKALEWCKTQTVTLLRYNEKTIGSYTESNSNFSGTSYGGGFNGSSNGTATTTGIIRYERTFKCN